MTRQVMNAVAISLSSFEFTRFPVQDKSETLSSKICMPMHYCIRHTKVENVFYILWGIELQIFVKYT